MRNLLFGFLLVGLLACNGGDGGTFPSESGSESIASLESDVQSAMQAGVPSFGGATFTSVEGRTIADWSTNIPHLAALGNGAVTNIAPQEYVDQVFDADYEVDGFGPTLFGRFSQEMFVVRTMAESVPFSNGVPQVGVWSVTAVVGDENETATFDVTVEASSDPDFDVKFNINEDFLKYHGALRNNGTEINLVGAEADRDDRRGMSVLFLNKATGKLRYTYVSKQSSGPTIEFHRILVEEAGGQAYVAHVYKSDDKEHKVIASANAGRSSTEFSGSFEKEDTVGGDDFPSQTWCIATATATPSSNTACASAALPAGSLDDIISQIDGFSDAKAMTDALLGVDFASIEDVTPPFDTGNIDSFLTTL